MWRSRSLSAEVFLQLSDLTKMRRRIIQGDALTNPVAAHHSLGWPRGQLSLTWRSFYPPTLTVAFGGLQHWWAGSRSPPPSTAALGLLPPISLFIIKKQQQQGSISFSDQFPRGPEY